MALPTVADFKTYRRVTTTVEDTLIAGLLASAVAAIETYLGRAIVGGTRTFGTVQTATSAAGYPVVRSLRGRAYRGDVSVSFATTAATTTAAVTGPSALDAEPDYTARIEPLLRQHVLWTAGLYYDQRNATAANESDGGAVAVTWEAVGESGLPLRVERALLPFRAITV